MSAPIPYGVATASELGAVTALRQLSTYPSSTKAAMARIIIAGFYKRQTVVHGDAPSWATWGGEKVMAQLEQSAYQDGSGCFAEQFISVRKQVGLHDSTIFSESHRPPSITPAQSQDHAWLELMNVPDVNDSKPILRRYVEGASSRGLSPADIASDLDVLESRLADAKIDRYLDACIQIRLEYKLRPSHQAGSKSQASGRASASVSQGFTNLTLSPDDTAAFLARRAVDGFVESETSVLKALASARAKREPGWAEMVLHGYCDHNRRNAKNVQAKLVALEKELRNRKMLQFAPEIYETRFLLSLPPSTIFPFVPPPPSTSSAPRELDWDTRAPVVRGSGPEDTADLPAYERVAPRV